MEDHVQPVKVVVKMQDTPEFGSLIIKAEDSIEIHSENVLACYNKGSPTCPCSYLM